MAHLRRHRTADLLAPLVIALGAVRDAPVVDGGRGVVGKTMRDCATFAHRLLDGVHASRLVSAVRRWMERPFEHVDPL
jgi:pyruvate/2-oxoglutarate dehydrogenase complex dihydrolipoamide acyltransferase (E2) component